MLTKIVQQVAHTELYQLKQNLCTGEVIVIRSREFVKNDITIIKTLPHFVSRCFFKGLDT